MKTKHILLAVIAIILVGTQPAAANQPPGAHVILAEVLILPIMALLSLFGGAYVIINHKKKKTRKLQTVIVAIVAIVVSGMHEAFGVLVALVFGIYALIRAFQMLSWGINARSFNQAHEYLAGANPRRLITAGVSLIVITVFLAGMAVAFVGFWPTIGQASHEIQLKNFVTHHIAYVRWAAKRSTQATDRQMADDIINMWELKPPNSLVSIEYSQDRNHFTVYMLPMGKMPFFPFNYLTSQPSYRADETGRIRMLRVHRRNHLCPEDAPVVMRVETEDIEDAFDNLVQNIGWSDKISQEK